MAPFIAATTGCATALAPPSKPTRPSWDLPAPPSGRLGAGDAQASSNSLLPLALGWADGSWSGGWAGSEGAGAPVSWQQYSPRNQKAERFNLGFVPEGTERLRNWEDVEWEKKSGAIIGRRMILPRTEGYLTSAVRHRSGFILSVNQVSCGALIAPCDGKLNACHPRSADAIHVRQTKVPPAATAAPPPMSGLTRNDQQQPQLRAFSSAHRSRRRRARTLSHLVAALFALMYANLGGSLRPPASFPPAFPQRDASSPPRIMDTPFRLAANPPLPLLPPPLTIVGDIFPDGIPSSEPPGCFGNFGEGAPDCDEGSGTPRLGKTGFLTCLIFRGDHCDSTHQRFATELNAAHFVSPTLDERRHQQIATSPHSGFRPLPLAPATLGCRVQSSLGIPLAWWFAPCPALPVLPRLFAADAKALGGCSGGRAMFLNKQRRMGEACARCTSASEVGGEDKSLPRLPEATRSRAPIIHIRERWAALIFHVRERKAAVAGDIIGATLVGTRHDVLSADIDIRWAHRSTRKPYQRYRLAYSCPHARNSRHVVV